SLRIFFLLPPPLFFALLFQIHFQGKHLTFQILAAPSISDAPSSFLLILLRTFFHNRMEGLYLPYHQLDPTLPLTSVHLNNKCQPLIVLEITVKNLNHTSSAHYSYHLTLIKVYYLYSQQQNARTPLVSISHHQASKEQIPTHFHLE